MTPSGSRTVSVNMSGRNGTVSPFELRTEPAEERKYVRKNRSLYSAFGAQRLAGLERNEPAEFLDVFVEYAAAFHDQFSALAGRQFRPCFLCVRGSLHRGVDIGGVTLGGLSDHRAGRRVDVRKRPAATRRHEGPPISSLPESSPARAHGSSSGLRRLFCMIYLFAEYKAPLSAVERN